MLKQEALLERRKKHMKFNYIGGKFSCESGEDESQIVKYL